MKKNRYHLRFTLNGEKKTLDVEPGISALELIRDILDLKGTKEGCGEGECGACTVLVDGEPVMSCLVPVCQVEGRKVETIESVGGPERLIPLDPDAYG